MWKECVFQGKLFVRIILMVLVEITEIKKAVLELRNLSFSVPLLCKNKWAHEAHTP
jgi:hypothetical protein